MGLPNYSIYFDGVDLASISGVSIYNFKVNSLPKRQLTLHKIANKDLSILTRAEYATKEIVVYANICGTSRGETEQILLNLKTALQPHNKQLTVSQYGETVNYTSTLYSIDDKWDVNSVDVAIIFTASDPVGRGVSVITLINEYTLTSGVVSASGTVLGSYEASPVFRVTYTSITGGTAQSVTVKNEVTSQGITVTRNWNNTDVLEVDCENKIVSVNGAIQDYTGAFCTLTPGTSTVGYIDTFSNRSAKLTVTYYKKFV